MIIIYRAKTHIYEKRTYKHDVQHLLQPRIIVHYSNARRNAKCGNTFNNCKNSLNYD